MIAKLRGMIDTLGDDYFIIDVNGVGYLVFASSKTLSRLKIGEQANILIETIVREESISLYGFYNALEKEWFLTLTKVQGVGAKVGLSILSALAPNQLAQAIAAQDKASFTRANGVGPKLAARLVTELKDKIVTIPITSTTTTAELAKELDMDANQEAEAYEDALVGRNEDPGMMEDALSALVNLGYQRLDAYRIVNQVLIANPTVQVSELIRLSLKEFAKKD